jgi:hypothetical protein
VVHTYAKQSYNQTLDTPGDVLAHLSPRGASPGRDARRPARKLPSGALGKRWEAARFGGGDLRVAFVGASFRALGLKEIYKGVVLSGLGP